MNEPIVIGIDPGSQDWTALAVMQRATEGHWQIHAIAHQLEPMLESLTRRMRRMIRDYSRPAGYSQSHWRKTWKERLGLGKEESHGKT